MTDPLRSEIVRLLIAGLTVDCEELAARYNRTATTVRRVKRDTLDALLQAEHRTLTALSR
jgi:hypothetical protein